MESREKLELINKYEPHFDAVTQFGVSDLRLGYKIKLRFAQGRETYTNKNLIQIGVDTLPTEDEPELVQMVDYLLGHEIQHIRSTPDRIWLWGQKRASEVFLEEVQKKVEKKKRLFRKDNDYELFLKWLNQNGYKMHLKMVADTMHGIMNMLEDGRIERIRAARKKGFQANMIYFRGKDWAKDEIKPEDLKKMNATRKLWIVLDQVRSLATMSIFSNGFKKAYDGTELMDICKDMIPHIKKAVTSPNCKGCMEEGIEIVKILTPMIFEAVQLDDFEKMLLDMLKKMLAEMESRFGDSESEMGSGAESTAIFGEADDLSEEEKPSDKEASNEGSIKSKKETSEKSEEESNENADADKPNAEMPDAEMKEGNNASGETNQEMDQDGNEGKGSSSADGSDGDEYNENGSDGSDSQEDESESKNPSNSKEGNRGNTQSKKSSAAGECKDIDKALEAVKNAMKEAALKQEHEKQIVKDAVTPQKKAAKPLSNVPQKKGEEKNDPVTANPKAENVVKLYPNASFKEVTREYAVDLPLPFELKGKSDVFSKKIDEVLKNQYKPAIRCRRSGKVDGMMLHKLAMNNTDIFVKPAIVNKFSGCCYMLVDNSGSMGDGEDSKREYAWNAIAEIEAGYSKLMPLKITAFDVSGMVIHEVVKDWEEVLPKSGAYNFMKKGRSGCGNMDGYSISIATDEILRQRGNKKLLLVLSDGAPDSREKTKKAIDYARKQGIVTVGIYFSEVGDTPSSYEIESFEGMYGTDGCAICCSPEKISEELFKVMRREFLR